MPRARPVPRAERSMPAEPPVPDLGRYGHGDEPDDERRRLVANLLAAMLLAALTAAGLWIASTMADLRKDQDCVLSGRRNCAGLPAAPPGTPPSP
ncbi:hypothetical protein GJ689_04240 [Rhodoplanes serenus]|uniref:Uncharacterized protein n=2 Tax=Rhodoplanes serenus TaxID=200615 RepID=A0A9X4XHW0_9BRAD|nr:hypothetical protein [Rhodoplanes serenus]